MYIAQFVDVLEPRIANLAPVSDDALPKIAVSPPFTLAVNLSLALNVVNIPVDGVVAPILPLNAPASFVEESVVPSKVSALPVANALVLEA